MVDFTKTLLTGALAITVALYFQEVNTSPVDNGVQQHRQLLSRVSELLGRVRFSDSTSAVPCECQDFKSGRCFAPQCAVCRPEALNVNKNLCFSPGPLGTGLLCHVFPNGTLSNRPCCGDPSDPTFNGTTCVLPPGGCRSKKDAAKKPLPSPFPSLEGTARTFNEATKTCSAITKKPFLDPAELKNVTIVNRTLLSSDIFSVRLALPNSLQDVGISTGQHIFVAVTSNGELKESAFSPISTRDERGYLDLMVKIPKKSGNVGNLLRLLPIGSTVSVRGPDGNFVYNGAGRLTITGKDGVAAKGTHSVKHLGLIAGGVGITPLYQILRTILVDSSDQTHVTMLWMNSESASAVLRSQLEALAEGDAWQRLKVWFVATQLSATDAGAWPYTVGPVTSDLIESLFAKPSFGAEAMILTCGVSPERGIIVPTLKSIGYNDSQVYHFW